MNKNLFLISSVCFFISNLSFSSGNGFFVGNGGGMLSCTPRSGEINDNFEYFSLDYLNGLQKYNANTLRFKNIFEIQPINIPIGNKNSLLLKKINQIEQNVLDLLLDKTPDLGSRFRSFLESTLITNTGKKYQWIDKSSLPIISTTTVDQFNRKCSLVQVVIREKKRDYIQFNYDFYAMYNISNYPLQKSMLLTHEWLWENTKDENAIVNINWFLHSKDAISLTPNNFTKKLADLGFNFTAHITEPLPQPTKVPRLKEWKEFSCEPDSWFSNSGECLPLEYISFEYKNKAKIEKLELLSGNSACQKAQSWGYEPGLISVDNTKVWVKKGCQGEFRIIYSYEQ